MCTAKSPRKTRRVRLGGHSPTNANSACPSKEEALAHRTSTAATTSLDASDNSHDSSPDRLRDLRELSACEARLRRLVCPVTGSLSNVLDDYRLCATVLGEGHYGIVRECEDRRTGQIYACKSVEKKKIRRLDHLQREICLLRELQHENVMRMVDCYEDATHVHIVTEKYTGGELFDRIAERTTPEGCFSEETTAGIVRSLLEAVAYLHENDCTHRDIKPENVLFESGREGAGIKLIDFGLSRKHREGEAPMSNPVGTAYYMAPELLRGRYTKACDVWSVGTIVYIMLCGYPPYNGEQDPDIFEAIKKGTFGFPSRAWADKSEGAKEFVRFLLDMDPEARPSAREALRHPWLRRHCRAEKKEEEAVTRTRSLRGTISRFRRNMRQECYFC